MVCVCLAADVFTFGRRDLRLLFLELFLVVLAIYGRNERSLAGETEV
jgi:hypothetical protein